MGGATGGEGRAAGGNLECLARGTGQQDEGGVLVGEGSDQDGEDAEQGLKRADRTGGWKEERFEGGEAGCREEWAVV